MNEQGIRRALVTGGAGFIGSHLVDALLRQGAEKVVVVDNFFLGKESNLHDAGAVAGNRLAVYRKDAGDLTEMRAVCESEAPDVVFNLATKTLLHSFVDPADACRVNVELVLCWAELLREGAYRRLIQVSSSEAFGSARALPMSEEHPLHPETPYAAGKAAADLTLRTYVNLYDLDAVVIRPFNNYGPRQNTGALAGVVPATIEAIRSGACPVVQGDGSQTRDFAFVLDTVAAILRIVAADARRGSVFNLGTGRETTILSLVQAICAAMGYRGSITFVEARTADVSRQRAGVARATALIGPLPSTSLDEGIARTIRFYEQRPVS